jgi:NADPH:quinone reductase-like Zn-dependent oxidoreductase
MRKVFAFLGDGSLPSARGGRELAAGGRGPADDQEGHRDRLVKRDLVGRIGVGRVGVGRFRQRLGQPLVAGKPQTVDHVHAAAVPRAGLTAWQGLFEHGKLAKGQTVVIHGAGGAVGSTAVQLARWAGADVIGTGRGRVRPLVTELGADRFIALDEDGPDADRLDDVNGQADLVFDTIGGDVLARSPALLRPGGTLVMIKADGPVPGKRDDITAVVFI